MSALTDPLDDLEAEHRIIEQVLGALEAVEPRQVDAAFFGDVVTFVRTFADDVHHDKEERLLFPAMERRGVLRQNGPLGVMHEEHDAARALVQKMAEGVDAGDVEALCQLGRAFAALMRDHIHKEEHALFPMGRGMLSRDDAMQLARDFAALPHADTSAAAGQALAASIARRVPSG